LPPKTEHASHKTRRLDEHQVVVPIFAILMERVFIFVEEHMLEEMFGPAWLDYKQQVRRWI
jgi:protein-S-isoprenylcysteine O-methyltransferase Ste14